MLDQNDNTTFRQTEPPPTLIPPAEFETTIPHRFSRTVMAHPDRLAVKANGRNYSYAELDIWASSIAAAIVDCIGSCGQPVAICFRQGAEGIAALLGVLKSGNAYVPLDPHYPPARLRAILADIGTPLILADGHTRGLASSIATGGQTIVDIDTIPPFAEPILTVPVDPYALAYVLYTSGSSGEPKGVMQTHRNVLSDTIRQNRDLGTTVGDRYGMIFSTSSSASVCHIFGALLCGAAVLPFDIRDEGYAGLTRWLLAEKITILDINVATFRAWCATLPPDPADAERFPSLRLLSPGSEPVYARDFELFRRHFSPGCILQNALGTTETRTVTQIFLTQQDRLAAALVPVGRPVENKDVRLVTGDGRDAGVGEIGEIVVQSDYLSPGYWRKPELTALAFREDADGRPVYHTGDLGRYDFDGNLIHLGRKDFQLKIRGFRAEPATIETALSRLPNVADAAVAVRADNRGESHLVGYLVLKDGELPPAPVLREILRDLLPAHEIPSRFVVLPALPVTLNGKLDRNALPAPTTWQGVGSGETDPTVGADEIHIAALFEELLNVECVGRRDNFFDLGGPFAPRNCAGKPPGNLDGNAGSGGPHRGRADCRAAGKRAVCPKDSPAVAGLLERRRA